MSSFYGFLIDRRQFKQYHINDIQSIGHMAALLFFYSCHPDRSLLACVKHEFKSEFGSIRHFGRFFNAWGCKWKVFTYSLFNLYGRFTGCFFLHERQAWVITFRWWYCCLGCKLITEAISMYMNGKRYSNVPKLFSISGPYDTCHFQSISCPTFCFHSKMLFCAICEIFVREIFPSVYKRNQNCGKGGRRVHGDNKYYLKRVVI